ncbi:MAG: hypothetical protein WBV06_16335 [Acidimicrobiia bacterium]
MKRSAIAVAALAMVLAACGEASGPASPDATPERLTDPSVTATSTTASSRGTERPPDLRVEAGTTVLSLHPYSYCWTVEQKGVCADGIPQEPLPAVTLNGDSELTVEFPLDWQLTASLSSAGRPCDGVMVIDADPHGSPLGPIGPAGTYRVDVFGRGDGGDAGWAFELVSSEDRPAPSPFWQVFWSPGVGELEADAPFSASVGNITSPPTGVSATALVTASNGASAEFDLSIGDVGGCPTSTIGLDGPADFTARVVALGPAPFSAILTVTMERQTFTSTPLRWPDDFPANSNESTRVPVNASSG